MEHFPQRRGTGVGVSKTMVPLGSKILPLAPAEKNRIFLESLSINCWQVQPAGRRTFLRIGCYLNPGGGRGVGNGIRFLKLVGYMKKIKSRVLTQNKY